MIQTVEKTFKWEMAHRLVGRDLEKGHSLQYEGNCRNLHGHSYKATITLQLVLKHLDEYGMVFDYNKMKIMKEWIDIHLDHSVLVSLYDLDLLLFIRSQTDRDKHYVIDYPTTAENIAKLLFEVASSKLNSKYAQVCSVKVNETESTEATYAI